MNFTIIIPLYNEAKNISLLNKELTSALIKIKKKYIHKFEIIYVEDGSTDNTFNILRKIKNKVETKIIKNNSNLSQSDAILNGLGLSKFKNIILLDGDLQSDPKDIIKLVNKYEKGYDLVHGNRRNRKDAYFSKILPSKIANFFVRLFTNSNISDHGCALKVFKKDLIIKNNFFGDFHRLMAAQIESSNSKISEIDVNHRPRKYGTSNYGMERISKILIDIIFVKFLKNNKPYYIFGKLGLFSFVFSLIIFGYMTYLKFFGNKTFIETPLPILVIFLTLSGLIFFSLSLFTEVILSKISFEKSKSINYKIYKLN